MNLPGMVIKGNGATPGSAQDNELRRVVGHRAFVIRLRYSGVFLPEKLIKGRPVQEGLLVSTCLDGRWTLRLHPLDGSSDCLLRDLSDANTLRQRPDGSWLIDGEEWDEGYLRRWSQTWLCAPSLQAGADLLCGMSSWLRARYTGCV